MTAQHTNTSSETDFVTTRVLNAPRDLVWKAFSETEQLVQWWGPIGFAIEVSKLDFRPGGVFHYCMKAPTGFTMWGRFAYREITAPELIVFINSFSDPQGGLTRAPWDMTWPLEVLNTLTLTEQAGKTTLTVRGGPINATEVELKSFAAAHDSMRQGFGGTWDKLEAYLATQLSKGSSN